MKTTVNSVYSSSIFVAVSRVLVEVGTVLKREANNLWKINTAKSTKRVIFTVENLAVDLFAKLLLCFS